MTLLTAKGARFDTSKPAKSNICMVLNAKGRQEMDILKITGNKTDVMMFGELTSMVEVEHSYGVDEVCEDFLWQ